MRIRLGKAIILLLLAVATGGADEAGWVPLTEKGLDAWKPLAKEWVLAKSVTLDPKDPRRLSAKPGGTILVNGPKGRTPDLVTKESHGDLEVKFDFLIPKGSNSGVKLHGLYEIQILDSHGAKGLTGDSCGGIYPRAELKPKYHHIDKGVAPKTNACKAAGEWQALHIVFRAPRFDAAGKKTANAHFVKVVLNDVVIHDHAELQWPTGGNWTKQEVAKGPLLLQADHGPVAFRNVRIRPCVSPEK